jgi:CBS domain-containing protein
MSDRQPVRGVTVLNDTRVGDVMSTPIVTCHSEVSLGEVAELMARHRIHAVVVVGDPSPAGDDALPWRVISANDLVEAAPFDYGATAAGWVASSPLLTVEHDESLQQAALLMSEYETSHVIVVEDAHPVGIVSALDVAARLAPAPAEPPAASAASAPPPWGGGLRARPGDRLVIRGHQLHEMERDAEVLEARGTDGGAPFLVRWEDTGHETLLYPGSDARIEHLDGRD